MTKIEFGQQWDGTAEGARVGNVKGHVAIEIGKEGDGWHSSMTPDTARELADALIREAEEAEQYHSVSEQDLYDALADY